MEEIIRNLDRIRDNNLYFTLDGVITNDSENDIPLFGKNSVFEKMLKKNHTVLKENDLDFSDKCHATLNVDILPKTIKLVNPLLTLDPLEKHNEIKSVSFSRCRLSFDGFNFYGILFFPHKKLNQANTLEIIAPFIPGLKGGDEIIIEVNSQEFQLVHNNKTTFNN